MRRLDAGGPIKHKMTTGGVVGCYGRLGPNVHAWIRKTTGRSVNGCVQAVV